VSAPGEPPAERQSAGQPIVNNAAASSLVERLRSASAIALDTEGDGMFRYRTRLCTVQLGAAGTIAVLDTLAVPAAPLLCELLGPRGPEKIIHDASFDARVLFAHGVEVANVFDTAVAARFLGIAATGLSSLLLKFFELRLPKHQQQADWGLRPIDAEAMRYLEDDVRYLEQLAERLLQEVRARDIEPEVREECAYLLAEARQAERAPDAAWMRIKGAALRLPRERARLFELAEEREQLARELDLPPARFIANDALLALARERPNTGDGVARVLGSRAEHAERFLAALARAEHSSDAPADQLAQLSPPPPSAAELTRRKRRKAALLEFRDAEAKRREVDVQVVLPGHCVGDIVELPRLDLDSLRSISGFGACRVDRYAALLEQRLSSRWGD
jgi:ribonuclease D